MMLKLFNKKKLLIIGFGLMANLVYAGQITKISPELVLQSKQALEQLIYRRKIVKRAIITGIIGVTGFTLLKAAPTISDYFKFTKDREKFRDFKIAPVEGDLLVKMDPANMNMLIAGLVDKQAKKTIEKRAIKHSWTTLTGWQKRLSNFFSHAPSAAGMLVLPLVGDYFQDSLKNIFTTLTIHNLIENHLALTKHFEFIDFKLMHLAPQQLLDNVNYKNNLPLLANARLLLHHLADSTDLAREMDRKLIKAALVQDFNELIKKSSCLIAYLRYVAKPSPNQSLILAAVDQLYQATYELAIKLDQALQTENDVDLLNQVALYRQTMNLTIISFKNFH